MEGYYEKTDDVVADFTLKGGGGVYLLHPHTEEAYHWLHEHTQVPYWDIPYCGIYVERETFIVMWEDIVKSNLNFTGAVQ